jgi:hypothetical protein
MNLSLSRFAASAALLLAAFVAVPEWALAQGGPTTAVTAEVNAFVQVTMNDGTLKFGTLLEVSDTDVVLQIAGLGATRIPKYLVQTISSLDVDAASMEDGYSYISNQPSRYFFAPSGLQLAEGEGYFQSNIALNSVSYGFSDRFTGGAMVSVLGGGVTAKYGGKVGEKTAVSFGGIAFMDFYQELDRPLAIGFVNVTRGDENKHFTLNVGLSNQTGDRIVSYDWSSHTEAMDQWGNIDYYPAGQTREHVNAMLLNFSGMTPLTSNRWLITENYLLLPALRRTTDEPFSNTYGFGTLGYQPYVYNNPSRENIGILALGIRSYNQRSGWLWDYGMAGVIGDGFGFPVPWFSFTLEF